MKKTLTLLVASTALSATFGLAAWSGPSAPLYSIPLDAVSAGADASNTPSLMFVSDDDDEGRGWLRWLGDDDDDDDGECEDDDEDDEDEDEDRRKNKYDDDDDCSGSIDTPAPAGTVAPPQNGLFGTDTPPQVQVN
ncbi:MAG: hypothetical protein KJ731_06385 [Alphaproteobacteria bacterium]|nr:hypothetical protein [Alphaproteobacteria bacterium]MBU1281174.1 hypothetical protein [Alphaproteobacteria bacterium]MBU1573208.1 hypothetical protein [Alphaproteobacteria bacterium]MBU1828089.1 hypothetical protein [Alphaproteobacteria bacterium]MBU2078264.1 hypothetical protein [Alphaproteobacteria bacterium]